MQFGPHPLFENVNIKFGSGKHYGLVGANGSGKSTFMKLLSGEIEPSSGEVVFENGIRIGKLQQDQFAFESIKVLDVVMMGHIEMWRAMKDKEAIYANPYSSEEDYIRAAELELKFSEYDGYTAPSRASQILLGLGIDEGQHCCPMGKVAPGWKLRVLLAQALFSNPDVLLLDEPTNNLDINTIHWLEDVLNSYRNTIIMISHDRQFLNQVCNHIADLDCREIQLYTGNYDDYIVASTQTRKQAVSNNTRIQARVTELQDFVHRFSANKSKSRQATSRLKQIDRIKAEQSEIKTSLRQNPYIRFEQNKMLYRVVLTAKNLSKSYDLNPVIRNFSITVNSGEKIAIIGTNGVGKTTLLRLLIKELEPDNGTIKWSENADCGYMAQDISRIFDRKDITVLDWMKQYQKSDEDDQSVRSVLGRLLFSANDILKVPKILSGGERNRMMFGRLMLSRHNIMLLDEPTNHLDIESIESLQLALEKYSGTLFFVSHDRKFISSLATRIIEIFPGGKIVEHLCGYEEYCANRATHL